MKNMFLAVVATLALCMLLSVSRLTSVHAQAYGAIGAGPIAPAVSNCSLSTAGSWSICGVGTSASNYAMYISYNGTAYTLFTGGAAAPPPPTIAAVAGTVLSGYNQGTNTWSVAPCVPAVTKALVLGTGIQAVASAPSTTAPAITLE